MSTLAITYQDATNLAAALRSLSGRLVDVKDGDGKVTILKKPYDITGKARYAIARTLSALKPILARAEEEREALFAKHADGKTEIPVDSPANPRFHKDVRDFMRSTCEFIPHRFSAADLKIETNQLGGDVIEALLPILDGEP